MSDLLAALNLNQQRAVRTVAGPVLIIAGAGTGKTRTLTHRLAYLAAEAGIAARKLLAITFTTKAAEEMRARVTGLCQTGIELSAMWIGTIHALCYEILKNHGAEIGLSGNFEIVSPADRIAIIRSLVKEQANQGPAGLVRQHALSISQEKNIASSYDNLSPLGCAYQAKLLAAGRLDFDDLILKTLELFSRAPATLARVRDRFSHICVDEYQDISPAQYRLVHRLSAPQHHLCAVGDADQAIYAFRGGRVENFLDFRRDFPQATVIILEENYRSTATIINAAQQVIEKNRQRIDKRLIPTRPPGPAVEIYELPNEQEEASFVAREIEHLLGGTRFENTGHAHDEPGAQGFGDIAVLYRLHAQGRVLRKALHDRGLPVQVAASLVLYEQPEIKPIIDFLSVLRNPHSDVALAEILTNTVPAIGPATVTKLATEARRQELPLLVFLQQSAALVSGLPRPAAGRLASLLDFFRTVDGASASVSLDALIRQIWNYLNGPAREPSDDLLEVMTSAMSFCHLPAAQAIPLFLKKISLAEEGDLLPPSCEAITLMTVHAAKGLEFGFVFLTGLEEGLFPYAPPNHDSTALELEEERRLFYVGMTRAKQRLYLSWARSRVLYGERGQAMPSAFLDEIPAEISTRTARSIQKKRREPSKQMKLFSV